MFDSYIIFCFANIFGGRSVYATVVFGLKYSFSCVGEKTCKNEY